MGSGKSSAAITYMNEHPEKKFIYVTPYLVEAARIVEACDNLVVFEPQKSKTSGWSKIVHTEQLIARGESIATTHVAFKSYPQEMLKMIKEYGYTLIMDEDVEMLEKLEEKKSDVQLVIDAGYVKEIEPNVYAGVDNPYTEGVHSEMIRMLKSRNIMVSQAKGDDETLYWTFPVDILKAFEDVFILTYMFHGQSIYYYLKMNGLDYTFMNIARDADGTYRFSDTERYVPQYVGHLNEMIHILDDKKLNSVGDRRTALSESWFRRRKNTDVQTLKNHLYNYYRNRVQAPNEERFWGSYKNEQTTIGGKGFKKSFEVFNCRAKNDYRNKTALAYCANVFMNVGKKLVYRQNGIEVDEDKYALSTMIQWIWRSAIRDGKEIWIYVPSKRMRTLLQEWIIDTEQNYT